MEFLFLGTSSGTPTKTRNVSGTAIRRKNSKTWYLVDCGEGTQHQLLHTSLSLRHLEAIFITHIHGDHCYGLIGLLASASLAGRTHALTIVGVPAIQQMIELMSQLSDLTLSYPIHFIDVDELDTWEGTGFSVEKLALSHRVPSVAYIFTENDLKPKLNIAKLKQHRIPVGEIWGQLQRGQDVTLEDNTVLLSRDYLIFKSSPRKIIISGDNDCPELLAEHCRNAQVLIHEATYTRSISEKVGASPQHSSAATVAQFAQAVELPTLVLTHFSARYQDSRTQSPSIEDVRDEACQYYHGQLFIAHDFDIYWLNHENEVTKISANYLS